VTELRLDAVHSGYGPIPVLADVDFAVSEGETVGVLGRNGVGKTTLLRTLVGMTQVTRGRVLLGTQSIVGRRTHVAGSAGIHFVPEDRGIFTALSVADNLRLAVLAGHPDRSTSARRERLRDALLERFPILGERLRQRAAVLSGGERQILAVSRALVAEPRFLLLDEFSEGVQPSLVRRLGEALRELPSAPAGVVLVDQSASVALRMSDRIYVMEKGRIVDEGPAIEFREDEQRLQARLVV
jgi:ABC-type branched-subunit amino acid transport system ATPase component